jgi:hypothetical protein
MQNDTKIEDLRSKIQGLIPDRLKAEHDSPPSTGLGDWGEFDKYWLLFENMTAAYFNKDLKNFAHILSEDCTLRYIVQVEDPKIPERFEALLEQCSPWRNGRNDPKILCLLGDVAKALLGLDLKNQKECIERNVNAGCKDLTNIFDEYNITVDFHYDTIEAGLTGLFKILDARHKRRIEDIRDCIEKEKFGDGRGKWREALNSLSGIPSGTEEITR